MKNKKGVSEMVGYVLLIVIAVGLSVAVFSYLKVFVPKDKAECSSDVALVVQQVTCDTTAPGGTLLDVTLLNRGLFTTDAVYLRMAESQRKVRDWVNNPQNSWIDEATQFRLTLQGLKPSQTYQISILVPSVEISGEYTLEVQPAVYVENELAICENAVITQPVTCT
jgi:FlaG/FlaF family flagellin (archaellin)